MATISSVALVQRKYRNVIESALRVAPTNYNMVKTEEWEGDRIEWRHKTAVNPAVGFTNEGAQFPVSQDPTLVSPFVGRKFLHGSTQMTNAAMRAARGGSNSFKSLQEFLIQDITEAYINRRNQAFAGDGTGIVGYVQGSATTAAGLTESSTTVTATHRFIRVGFDTTNQWQRTVNPATGVWENGRYDIIDTNSADTSKTDDVSLGEVQVQYRIPKASALEVVYVGLKSGYGLPAGIETGDALCVKDSFGLAYDGLASLIDNDVSGTFQGVDYTADLTASRLVSTVLSNGGTKRDLSQELLNRMFQGMSERSNGDAPPSGLKLIGHASMMHEINKLYLGEVRLTPSDKVGGSAVNAIATPFGNAELKPDNFFAPGNLYFVDPSKLGFVVQQPMSFLSSVLGQSGTWVQNRSAAVLEAKIYEIAQMVIYERRTSGKILDLNGKLITGL